jgi:hypothetical protein
MARVKRPLFLARSMYRRRRLRDAARLLPVFATLFLILPILWSPPDTTARQTSGDVIYFFGLWLVLVLVAAAFAPGLSAEDPQQDGAEGED